ncbi:MAG: LysR family transcriptional regulator [marine bacterium B5-7]|nr:MAG: LysR family transcriptional regulator [marine bacterium B5-7]
MQRYTAKMQIKNWNDFRYLVAIKRAGTLSAAARLLGVDDTTVTRRLMALKELLDTELFHRQSDGVLQLTHIGHLIADRVEVMENQVDQIGDVLGKQRQQVLGTVRVTSVPMVINRLLVPALTRLFNQHPELEVELIPDNRNLSLTRREADLAIRLARPVIGGSRVKARRIGIFDYAIYADKRIQPKKVEKMPWITYDDTMAHLPQAKLLARSARSDGNSRCRLKVVDAETAIEATLSGIGKTILPAIVGERIRGLRQVVRNDDIPLLAREVWLLSHVDQADFLNIRTVASWIGDEALAAPG